MTVPVSSRKVTYTGNGATKDFTVTFPFFEIAVYADGVIVSTADYAVSGGDGATGTVTFNTAPASSVEIVIVGATEAKQETDYVDDGPFPAQTHEAALDRLTMLIQELILFNTQGLRVPVYQDAPDELSGTNKVLYFDATGTPVLLDAMDFIGELDSAIADVVASSAAAAAASADDAAASAAVIAGYGSELTDILAITSLVGGALRFTYGSGVTLTLGTDGILLGSGHAKFDTMEVAGVGVKFQDGNFQRYPSKLLQSVTGSYTSNANLTTAIPADDTIPQNTEGTEIVTVTITPKRSDSTIRIRFSGMCAFPIGSSQQVTAAVFQDSAADAIFATGKLVGVAVIDALSGEFTVAAGSTTARTYKLRVGAASGTVRMNGNAAGRHYGGIAATTLTAEEIAA